MPASLPRPVIRRFPVLIALLGALLAVTGVMVWGIRSFDASARWVNHTYEVLGQIESVRAALDATESTARGYRLTHDPRLENDYATHRPRAQARADALVRLVEDNPDQNRRAQALQALVTRRLAEIEQATELQRAGRTDVANRLMLDRGLATNADIERVAGDMARVERRLLTERSAASVRESLRLTIFVVAGMLLSVAMLIVLLVMIGRETRRSKRLEREARDALVTLEASIEQRELLAEQRRVLAAFAGLLHSCQTAEEALDVAGNALAQLVPNGAGVCYLMRASQNLLELHALFGTHGSEYPDAMRPEQCWALRRGSLHLYDPARPTARCEHLHDLTPEQACGVCVPLTSQGTTLGLLHVGSRLDAPLSDIELAAVESVAEHLGVVLYSLDLRESLRVQSLRDPLTGLYNRRYLEESLPREMERCERRGRPLSVLMVDVDYFKRFNDEHGHGAGDALLTKIGQVLAAVTRGEDIACRYGGEEFTIVMPEAGLEQAAMRAEQIRLAIAEASITYMRRELGPVTASIGVHELQVGLDTPETLLATADRALYAAKAQGRNRVLRATLPSVRGDGLPGDLRA
ncbi:sensor domain-containing diguanylate cyclase [Lysobacter claricitrinus]|uniref:sensor domain-containing diguanylate cyclase n=1 Tax=Lysobacter claricitrinus TaxID=3367728 RepID=UPI0037DB9C81